MSSHIPQHKGQTEKDASMVNAEYSATAMLFIYFTFLFPPVLANLASVSRTASVAATPKWTIGLG